MIDTAQDVCWEISVPIFQKKVILKQIGLTIGIPFGLVALVIVLSSGRRWDTLYALGFIAALLFFTWLFVMAAYRSKYDAEFLPDQKGALCRTQARQAKKNRVINTVTVIFGLLSGRPAAAGAGMLAQSRQEVFLRWNRITKAKYKPQSCTILLSGGGWSEQIALFCTQDNYEQIESFILQKMQQTDEVSRK